MNEQQVKDAGIDYMKGEYSLKAHSKAIAVGAADGVVKILASKPYGEILGAHIIGHDASELIAEIGLAVRENCEKVGRNPDTFAITADLIFARDQNMEVADQIAGQIASMARSWGRSAKVTQWDHSGVLYGDAGHMLDQIEVFKSVGVSEIVVSISSIEDALWFNENVLRKL